MSVPLVINGSARTQGDTTAFVQHLFLSVNHQVVSLSSYFVSPYNYEHNYPKGDQFPEIINLVLSTDVVVLATPVYWYAMSGLMKTLFDRFTDLVTIDKQIGRQLADKKIFVIAVGAEPELPTGFEVPFKSTSRYLRMDYCGCIYHSTKHGRESEENEIRDFRRIVTNKG